MTDHKKVYKNKYRKKSEYEKNLIKIAGEKKSKITLLRDPKYPNSPLFSSFDQPFREMPRSTELPKIPKIPRFNIEQHKKGFELRKKYEHPKKTKTPRSFKNEVDEPLISSFTESITEEESTNIIRDEEEEDGELIDLLEEIRESPNTTNSNDDDDFKDLLEVLLTDRKDDVEILDELVEESDIEFKVSIRIQRSGNVSVKHGSFEIISAEDEVESGNQFNRFVKTVLENTNWDNITGKEIHSIVSKSEMEVTTCHRCLKKSNKLLQYGKIFLCKECEENVQTRKIKSEDMFVIICDKDHVHVHESEGSPCPLCH